MAFRVDLTPQAEADLEEIFDWVADRSEAPERCPVVQALSRGQDTVRQLLFGRKRNVYRIYFCVREDVVKVLHVRHGARRRPRKLNDS